jgi:hypothetical protein
VRRYLEACAHDGDRGLSVSGDLQLNAAHAPYYGKETAKTQDLGCSRDHSRNISNPACIAVWREGAEGQIRTRELREKSGRVPSVRLVLCSQRSSMWRATVRAQLHESSAARKTMPV